jgi:exosortase A-associated hydrolase 2
MAPEAFFLTVADAPHSQRFCLYHPPAAGSAARGALIHLHAFAEEMNKSRRMTALAARRLAQQGYAVLQIDLHGCGDSDGDFGDATWASWLQDVRAARTWLRQRSAAPLWLWGLRAGSLLAAAAAAAAADLDAADEPAEPVSLLLWQPVIAGKQHLQQFLRLKVAGEMMSGDSKGVMAALKQTLADGTAVEIAGYTLAPGLAHGLDTAELAPPARPGRIVWLELSSRPEPALAPASIKCIERWEAAGWQLESAVVPGPTFWQTVEIEEAPALLDATLDMLERATP